jgi:hypothetical protein
MFVIVTDRQRRQGASHPLPRVIASALIEVHAVHAVRGRDTAEEKKRREGWLRQTGIRRSMRR